MNAGTVAQVKTRFSEDGFVSILILDAKTFFYASDIEKNDVYYSRKQDKFLETYMTNVTIQGRKCPFNVEWLPDAPQSYHGPRRRMKELLHKYPVSDAKAFNQEQVVEYILKKYIRYSHAIDKVKFYRIFGEGSNMPLRFFLMWCNYNLEVREELFISSEEITASTGWYPVITGHRAFHHKRHLLDFIDSGLRKAMNKSNIEKLPGLGNLSNILKFSNGSGTSILLQTTTYDLILDTGMPDDELNSNDLRGQSRKWLFVSHSHKDHTGRLPLFIRDRKFVISMSPMTFELFLNAVSESVNFSTYLPAHFFYRLAPMWYRSKYRFADGSSIETVPTYHFPGSLGYLFTFSNGKTLFYSGDLNVSVSYLNKILGLDENETFTFDLGRAFVDYGIIEGAFVGRVIGSKGGTTQNLSQAVYASISKGRNHLLLTPPSDYGLFLFIYLYGTVISRSTSKVDARLFVDPQIIRQLEIIEWRMKRKQTGSLDNALLKFLDNRTTLLESVRVYDFSSSIEENLMQLNHRNIPGVFILDDQRYGSHNYPSQSVLALMEQSGLDITRVGKAATYPIASNLIRESGVVNYDGSKWLLHSSENMLSEYLIKGKQQYGQVYLFHNFKGRFDKFITKLKQAGYCGPILSL